MFKRLLFLLICMISFFYYRKRIKQAKIKKYGTVIILNGPSSSGKSSIQKEFQYLMLQNLWAKLGIDNLFDKPFPNINLENISYWQSKMIYDGLRLV